MSQPTIYIPFAFARPSQDPQSRSDNPTPVPGTTDTAGPTPTPTTGERGDPNAKTQPTPSICAGDGMMYFLPAMLLLMYFMMIRPEQKRKKEQATLLSSIKVGEAVVMLSGMHAMVTNLDEKTVTVCTEDGSRIKFDRSAVARIVRDEAAASGTS